MAMPWAGSPGLRERPVVAMGKAGGEDANKGDDESIRRAGARAQAAEAGAWGATVGAGEAVRCVTRAGGRSILGGQGKEFRGQQRRLLCQSRGTGSTRPGSDGVSGRSVAQRNEPEAQLSIRLSDEPVKGGVHGCDGQG